MVKFKIVLTFTLIILSTLSACLHRKNDRHDLGPVREAYQQNLAKWQDADIHDYQFNYQKFCFCGDIREVVIQVQEDKVSSAFYFESGEYLSDTQLATLPTMETLFNKIDDAIIRNAYKISASYDEDYGYPVDVSIDYDQYAIDEEFGFTVSNFM